VARQAEQDQSPAHDPVLSIADMNAGLHGLVAILSALYLRERTGRGQHIDIAMLDTMLLTDDYANFALDEIPLIRGGGEVWDAPGGPIMITGDFRVVWKLLTRHHGVVDPTPPGAELEEKIRLRREAVANFLGGFPDRPALIKALDAVNLAWGDIRSNEAAFDSPTARARGTVARVDDRGGGQRPVVESPYRFSDAESRVKAGPAYRGEHNGEVLESWLGASHEEIRRLEQEGILQAEPGPGSASPGRPGHSIEPS
jgi:crotonobetainyl-CoA:carnitine CoA-transferase CaiB-like acyl-CoA transferase